MSKEFILAMNKFFHDREWEKFHSPKNLVMDMGSEVGELLDHFRWLTEEESYHPEKIQEIKDEIGDIFIVLHNFAGKLGIDPLVAAKEKLVKMEKRYPVALSKGSSRKYTEFE